MQIIALLMLAVPETMLSVIWVMIAQAISGIAKDLNKMSAKSAIKTLVPSDQQATLYKWVALLTGSKNALKGGGFFLGGALLLWLGFQGAVLSMAAVLAGVLVVSLAKLEKNLGKAKAKTKFSQIFSKSKSVNILSFARLFLFGARDVWFVVALPVYLGQVFSWDHIWVGAFMACWVVAYGVVQALAPRITGVQGGKVPGGREAVFWAFVLIFIPSLTAYFVGQGVAPQITIVVGLMVFGAAFAVNSSLHSYLIVSYAKEEGASLDVGFYYMANAMGRLMGTVLSGWLYQEYGFVVCLWASGILLFIAMLASVALPNHDSRQESV